MFKFTFALIAYVLSFSAGFAQDFQGMAVYESKTSTADFKARMQFNKDMTPDMQKMIEDRMKSMFEKTYHLFFSRTTSVYKEEEKLEAAGQSTGVRIMSNMMGSGGSFYKNTKDKTYTVDKEFMGKEFLIQDSLPNLAWKLESETKQIGGYNCFKATAIREASKTDFRNFRMKKKEDEKKEETGKTNLLDELDLPKEIAITAWYTPEIPISQGPENYWGLPGLILEVNDGKTTILCSKVVLNLKDKVEIKAPTKGEEITQKKYDETVIKKMEEFRAMGGGRNGSMQIRMGN
ncbi:MAG: GLPGLI family protein [Flavobacterium sp.]|nr:GLPGLI family protein [Flavobacterium sp.]